MHLQLLGHHFVQEQPSARLTRYPLAEFLLVEALLAEVVLAEVVLAEVLLVEALQLKLRQPPLDFERQPQYPHPLGPVQELQTRLVSSLRPSPPGSICN